MRDLVRNTFAISATAACLSACGGTQPPIGGNASSVTQTRLSLHQPASRMRQSNTGSCTTDTDAENFNNTPISAGYWLLFTSVFNIPGTPSALRFHVADSKITLTSGSTTYTIQAPGSRISLHSQSNAHLNWAGSANHHGIWWLMVPYGTTGDEFLDQVAWKVPTNLPGDIKKVAWSATFYSGQNAGAHIQLRWGAAVYSQLDNFPYDYNNLGTKPLDDPAYPPYNNDPAGTPENDKAYLVAGGTGEGGTEYTGKLGETVNAYPCKR